MISNCVLMTTNVSDNQYEDKTRLALWLETLAPLSFLPEGVHILHNQLTLLCRLRRRLLEIILTLES